MTLPWFFQLLLRLGRRPRLCRFQAWESLASPWAESSWGFQAVRMAFWRAVGCSHLGHMTDEGYASPDRGGMAGRCTRCGYSYSVTLY